MNRTQKGFSLVELLLLLLIIGIICVVAIPTLNETKTKTEVFREIHATHPEAVRIVKLERNAAGHYVATIKNKDNSESVYTLPRK